MNFIRVNFKKISYPVRWFMGMKLIVKLGIVLAISVLSWFAYPKVFNAKAQQPKYQTAQVERGTLVVSITASGQVATTNSASVTTNASGVVKTLFVQNGQEVSTGDQIAELDLDQISQQKYSQLLASYQSAKNSLDAAKSTQLTLQADMFSKWNTFKKLSENDTYKDPNSANRSVAEFNIPDREWLAAEAKYKNQANVIAQTQTSLQDAWLTLQQSSAIIYAPISGTVTGLSLQPGSVIASSSGSSSTTTAGQKVASIKTNARPTISINLTEIDVTKISVDNKATITFDAFPDKTYTGRVVSVDTVGTVTSGVTTYPTVIQLDVENPTILSNMAASASIITQTKTDIFLVPSSAVQTQNNGSVVQVMRKGIAIDIPVQVGISSDTQTEIVSGLSEGDEVVTGITTQNTPPQSAQTQSPFSGFGRGGNFGGAAGRGGR